MSYKVPTSVFASKKAHEQNYRKYYWNYVYLDIIEENNLTTDECPTIEWQGGELSLDEELVTFTAYDLDIILNTIKLPEVQELNQSLFLQ
ncbi:hypothetical protein [Lacrimispora sp. 38-1]|uniref:hypothetical protein n=1 Tax=Lacrimispora sp. 38-1 TaxID=3125778 RepID=UPI003CEA2149